MTPQEKKQRLDSLPGWWHSIDFGDGVVSKGAKGTLDEMRGSYELMRMPDFNGKTVLDVGANDGFFSFEAEKRGAKKVLAVDYTVWATDFHKINIEKEGFDPEKTGALSFTELEGMKRFKLARELLGSKVESKILDVQKLTPEDVGMWDICLFLGVYYHLPHPLLAFENLAKVVKEEIIVEGHSVKAPGWEKTPFMVFYHDNVLENDRTNFWGANAECLCQMLRSVGFSKTEVVFDHQEDLWVDPNSPSKTKAADHTMSYGRSIIHAWK